MSEVMAHPEVDRATTAEDQFIEAVTAELVDYFNGSDSRRVLRGK
jgi:hypothetical protein